MRLTFGVVTVTLALGFLLGGLSYFLCESLYLVTLGAEYLKLALMASLFFVFAQGCILGAWFLATRDEVIRHVLSLLLVGGAAFFLMFSVLFSYQGVLT